MIRYHRLGLQPEEELAARATRQPPEVYQLVLAHDAAVQPNAARDRLRREAVAAWRAGDQASAVELLRRSRLVPVTPEKVRSDGGGQGEPW
jgi:hypothetical protein